MSGGNFDDMANPTPLDATPAWRTFELTMLAVIVVAIVAFTVETLPGLSGQTRHVLRLIEVVTVATFTLEYGVRLLVAERKLRFACSFYGIIDLLAILPFYFVLATGLVHEWQTPLSPAGSSAAHIEAAHAVDLRVLRILRIFVLFRALKLVRYNRALGLFTDALREVREQLVLYLLATGFMIYLASAGIYYFEHVEQPDAFPSIIHSMWWAVVTLTTVGYGDTYPVTVGGRVFTGLLLLIGVGVIAVPSGLIASGLASARQKNESAPEE